MATIGSLSAILKLNSTNFNKGLNKASKRSKKFRKGLKSSMATVVKFGGALAAIAGIGGVTVMTKNMFKAIDATAKWSDKLGITTEELSSLQFAAGLTGVETNTFNMALQRMTRRLSEAAVGTGEAKAAISELGLSADILVKASPDQAFRMIADEISKIPGQADRVRLAFKFFDSEGVALVNLLGMGAAGIRDFQIEAKNLWLTFDREAAATVEIANDAIKKVQGLIKGLFMQLAIQLAPMIAATAETFTKWGIEGSGAADQISNSMSGLMFTFQTLVKVGKTFSFLLKGLAALILRIAALITTLAPKVKALLAGDVKGFVKPSFMGRALLDEANKMSEEASKTMGEVFSEDPLGINNTLADVKTRAEEIAEGMKKRREESQTDWNEWRKGTADFLKDKFDADPTSPLAPKAPPLTSPGKSLLTRPTGAAAQVRRGTFVMGASGRSARVPILGDPAQTEFMRRIEANTRRGITARAA